MAPNWKGAPTFFLDTTHDWQPKNDFRHILCLFPSSLQAKDLYLLWVGKETKVGWVEQLMFHSSLSSQAGEAVLLSNNISLVIPALPSVSSHQSLHVETCLRRPFSPYLCCVVLFKVLLLIDGYRLPFALFSYSVTGFQGKVRRNTMHRALEGKLPVLCILSDDFSWPTHSQRLKKTSFIMLNTHLCHCL